MLLVGVTDTHCWRPSSVSLQSRTASASCWFGCKGRRTAATVACADESSPPESLNQRYGLLFRDVSVGRISDHLDVTHKLRSRNSRQNPANESLPRGRHHSGICPGSNSSTFIAQRKGTYAICNRHHSKMPEL